MSATPLFGRSLDKMAAGSREPFQRINADLVILELWEDFHARWYDLYYHLGLKKEVLDELAVKYQRDPKVCMHEATRLWFEQGDPKPSWERIAHVLRYKLLEPDRADLLEGILGLAGRPNPLIGRGAALADRRFVTEEEMTAIFGERDSNPFGDLLTEVLDEFMSDPSPYLVAFYVTTLCSPNMTQMLDPKLIWYPKSIDGVILPLVLHNYISNYDIDFLLHLINVFDKEETLLPHVKHFTEQRQLGQPSVRKIRNNKQNFMIRCICNADHPSINWKTIKEVKNTLKQVLDFTKFPYLLHFIGWSVDPLSLCFQLPLACMAMVRVSLYKYPDALVEAKIIKVYLEVGSAKFVFDSV